MFVAPLGKLILFATIETADGKISTGNSVETPMVFPVMFSQNSKALQNAATWMVETC